VDYVFKPGEMNIVDSLVTVRTRARPHPAVSFFCVLHFSAAHAELSPPALRALMSLDACNSFSRSQVFVVMSAVLEGIKINLSKAVFQVTHSPHCPFCRWLTDMSRASRTAALHLSIRSRVCARSPSLATTFYPCSSSQPAASSSSIYRRYRMSIPSICAPSCQCLQARIRHSLLLHALLPLLSSTSTSRRSCRQNCRHICGHLLVRHHCIRSSSPGKLVVNSSPLLLFR